MIRRLGFAFAALSHRFVPHPFVFALLLTLAAFVMGLVWARESPRSLVDAWYQGIWTPPLLVFALQMALILVTGHALAETRPVRRLLDAVAGRVRGTASGVMLTSWVAMTCALLNWGLGLIVGALLARSVARRARERGIAIHYPLVVAAGYTGLLVWHGGLSGSAPVSVATEGHPLAAQMGILPIGETLLSSTNFWITGFLLAAVPLALALMAPPLDRIEESTVSVEPDRDDDPPPHPTFASRLERSPVLVALAAALGLVFLIPHFAERGWAGVNLNSMIFVFLIAGLLLHGSPLRYARVVDEAASGAGGILLQFPFYFGIMGIMRGAGLVERLAQLFVTATETLASWGLPAASVYSCLTFLSAGLVNLFVPSGGGQWAVQGPIAVEAAGRLGIDLPTVVLALAYGDQLTNMLQPFWALPLLAITGVPARTIVGYTALLMILVTPPLLILLWVLAI